MQHADTRFVEQMISNRFPGLFIRTEISQTEIDVSKQSVYFIFHYDLLLLRNEFRSPQIVE